MNYLFTEGWSLLVWYTPLTFLVYVLYLTNLCTPCIKYILNLREIEIWSFILLFCLLRWFNIKWYSIKLLQAVLPKMESTSDDKHLVTSFTKYSYFNNMWTCFTYDNRTYTMEYMVITHVCRRVGTILT